MKEIEKHENLKQCAIYSYGKKQQLPPGFICVQNKHNYLTGMQASIIKDNDNIVIAFAGTNSPMDIFHSDAAMGLKLLPIQHKEALRIYEQVREQYPNVKIILTGHSLGGSLAQIVGAIHDVETVTFNAYGTKDLIKSDMTIYPDKITNYVNLNDYEIITKNTHNQIGTCYSISSKVGATNNHDAEEMLPLRSRKKFDQQKYGRSQGKQAREVHTSSAGCTGSYPVSSYTRSDGTKVDGYTRTCYVHGGNVLRGYSGKALKDMSADDIDELLEDYL